MMKGFCRTAAFAAACVAAPVAWGAAPAGLEEPIAVPDVANVAPIKVYQLDKEMVVRNWVLCTSQDVAEQLVQARAEGAEQGRAAYAGLKGSHACGQFPELRVILKSAIYEAPSESGDDSRIFGALVSFSDKWASAYVVDGGLPEN